MKKKIITILLVTVFFTVLAQEEDKTRTYHNEFGIDATSFIRQFTNLAYAQNQTIYMPTYYLTYRRHFSYGSLRVAIGGAFSNQELPSNYGPDSTKYEHNSNSLDARIGWEFARKLSKRWQVFYGVDFRPSVSYDKNDQLYWNTGYKVGRETKTEIYSVAPLIGFRFDLTERLSLTTEASFSVCWATTTSKQYYKPMSIQYPAVPDLVSPSLKKLYSSFYQPITVMFAFDI